MGKTASITQMEQQNQGFSTYLDQCTANLMEMAKNDLAVFDTGTSDFYANPGWDNQLLGRGINKNFQLSNESSTDTIKAVVRNIAVSIFGQPSGVVASPNVALPEGTTVDKAAVAAVTTNLAGFESLATEGALTAVINMVASFTANPSLNYTSSTIRQSLAPGVTLHLFSFNAGFMQSTFFNNVMLFETVFSYKIIFSVKQALLQQEMKFIQDCQNLVAKLKATQTLIQEKYNKSKAVFDGSAEAKAEIDNLQKALDMVTVQINNYQAQIDAAIAKYNSGELK